MAVTLKIPSHYKCVEHINYTPVSINQIIKSGLLNEIDDIHRATIDRATEYKRYKNRFLFKN